jgi:hypothetical protein
MVNDNQPRVIDGDRKSSIGDESILTDLLDKEIVVYRKVKKCSA